MRLLVFVCVFFAFALPVRLPACVLPPAAQFFTQKDVGFILVGTATGSIWQRHSSEYLVTYKVLEVLQSTAPSTLSATTLCGLPFRRGERVVVGSVQGQQIVYPAYEEAAIRAAIRGVR